MTSFIFSLTAGSVLFLFFLVFTNPRKVNVKANRWLAFFLFSLFLILSGEPLHAHKIYQAYPHILGFESFLIFATAPAVYMSVMHYISLEKKISKKDFLHFLPTLLFFPIIAQTMLLSKAEKLKIIEEELNFEGAGIDIITLLIVLQMCLYIGFALYKLLKHQKNVKLFASDTSKIDLNWLKNALVGLVIMIVLWLAEMYSYEYPLFTKISTIGYFLSIYFIGYHILQQGEIYPFKETEKEELKEIIEEEEKTTNNRISRISTEELERLKERVSELMITEKLFLDETLNLPKLAEKSETSIHNLSYVLNEGFNENFFQFVNRYRIEEAKSLLLSSKYQQLSMLGIAFESGFSSKTTFNTTFKKVTGISPSEFINENISEKIVA